MIQKSFIQIANSFIYHHDDNIYDTFHKIDMIQVLDLFKFSVSHDIGNQISFIFINNIVSVLYYVTFNTDFIFKFNFFKNIIVWLTKLRNYWLSNSVN